MSGLFGGKAPAIPEPKPPAPMPDKESPAIKEAQRRAALETMQRGGRDSTILSDSSKRASSAPTADYSRKTLGGQ